MSQANPHQPLFSAKDLKFEYLLDQIKVQALRGINIEIQAGELVCLSGPSGSGKTTLLNLLGLIDIPTSGTLALLGQDIGRANEKLRTEIRLRQLGFVFQNFNLIPSLSAEENVEFFLIRQGVAASERKKIVTEALESVGLADQRKKRPMQMSGGQRQRVAIARALAKRPQVIIADEPTASLDQKTGKELMALMQKLNQERGVSIIIASHDPMVMGSVKRNVRMQDGLLAEGRDA